MVKALKNSLSRYLRAAQAGETVPVTERGKVIAELRARTIVPALREEEALAALESAGVLTRGTGVPSASAPVALKRGASATATVLRDRGVTGLW